MGGDKNDKATTMVLKVVDLHCSSCFKKVKKILCKFPQIRDQAYDEKANTVTITVVCCNPEKFRDKLCIKGCGVIISIEIKETPKPIKPPKEKHAKPKPDVIEKTEKSTVVVTEKTKETVIVILMPYAIPVPPPPCYYKCECSYGPCGYWRGYYVSRCECFNDENATGCSNM